MARRPAGCLGWIVVLVIGVGWLGSLNHREANDTSRNVVIERRTSEPASPSATPAPTRQPIAARTLYVNATSLNVRSRPDAAADILLAAPHGTPVTAVGQVAGWYEVQLSNGSTGWMSADYLSAQQPAAPQRFVEAPAPAPRRSYDRSQVVQAIIRQSIASYSGNCPCPYNTMRNGRNCGGNSAYSKPGGASPVCYPSDVTQRMIDEYLARR